MIRAVGRRLRAANYEGTADWLLMLVAVALIGAVVLGHVTESPVQIANLAR